MATVPIPSLSDSTATAGKASPADAASPERLRIFVSSPGDVAQERVVANNLIGRLADECAGRVRIEPIFWEHEPLLASEAFQNQILPPHDCDIVICILWSRLGTRLPASMIRADGTRYASGTEYEFEDAFEGWKKNGKPDLLVYRKTAKPMADLDDKKEVLRRLEQKESLDQFVQKWFYDDNEAGTPKAAFHTFETTAEFEQTLEHHLRKLIARRAPAAAPTRSIAKPSWTNGSPFRGLEVFDFQHAPVFFGRTHAVSDLLHNLRAAADDDRAFVLVVGISGGGKSSLVRAGLLPLLVQPGVIEGVGLWRRAVLKPADAADPILSLANALTAPEALPELTSDGTTPVQLAAQLRSNPVGADLLIKGALSQAAATKARERNQPQQPSARLALVVDQIEELFTLPNLTPTDRKTFVAILGSLAHGGRTWVIATLRGDYYHRIFEIPELVALQEGVSQFALPLPTAAEIGQMVRLPATAAGLHFEEDPSTGQGLDEMLREGAAASPESLPLLEFALDELYRRRTSDGLLTCAAYRELGGVEGALARRADAVFESLPAEVQRTLPRVLRGLVNVSESDAVARQQAEMDAVAPGPAHRAMVDAFVAARLFSADRTDDGKATVRVTHEALLRHWPRLIEWLHQDRELLLIRARISAAARRWQADGRRNDLLLPAGLPLAEAGRLLASLGEELSPTDKAFIAASRRRRVRNRLAGVGVALLLITTAIVIRWRVVESQKATTADGLVKRLIDADITQVPQIVRDIGGYRRWADPLLRREDEQAAAESKQKLRTSLALLPVDAGQVDYLYRRLLAAEPGEVAVIRQALGPHKSALKDRLWQAVESPAPGTEAGRIRAAAALALYEPKSERWASVGQAVADDLVKMPAVYLSSWMEDFRPSRAALIPPLSVIYRDTTRRDAERSMATGLLADYAADNPAAMANLLMDSDPQQFATMFAVASRSAGPVIPPLTAEVRKHFAEDDDEAEREQLAHRQANAGIALIKLNHPEHVWPLLKHSADPRTRTYIIHLLKPLGADPQVVVGRLGEERDISTRRALLLCVGEYWKSNPPAGVTSALLPKLKTTFQSDPDPGVRAAAEWVLRMWGQQEWLTSQSAPSSAPAAIDQKPQPFWYVNSQGQTMIGIPGPVEFNMGSPETEEGRARHEKPHAVRIPRTFAVAAKTVTLAEYRRMIPSYDIRDERFTYSTDLPVNGISWHQAAQYCNWLSEQEGIAPDQWCYEISDKGQVIKTRPGYLSRSGYRLPTEAELEYVTRAGTETPRYYGTSEDLLGQYAWYAANTGDRLQKVGLKKPNDFGFFDIQGNIWSWAQDRYMDYPTPGTVVVDSEGGLQFSDAISRVLRGGAFNQQANNIRSACRGLNLPVGHTNFGIRPARTLQPKPTTRPVS